MSATALDSISPSVPPGGRPPQPIVALDFPTAEEALRLVARVGDADFFKVGLQLFTAAGPDLVRRLKGLGHRVFLDLKFHDIPNTVAGAVRSAASLEVDLLTIHASGGPAMMRAAADAAAASAFQPRIFAVSILTSMDEGELAAAWGHASSPSVEAPRLAALAARCGVDGVVTSVHEVEAIRRRGSDLLVLTPGIRLAGDPAGDQARVATPADAARLGVDFVVIGRSVTSAADPARAYDRVARELAP